MKELLFSLSLIAFLSLHVSAQPFDPQFSVDVTFDPDLKILKGECKISLQCHLSDIKINLWANQFKSKTTDYANYSLDNYSNQFYFYKEEELGGYQSLEVKANGQEIPINGAPETLTFEWPANGTQTHDIHIKFVLKLPKKIEGFGYEHSITALKNWYPTISYHDGKTWAPLTYYLGSVLPESFGKHNVILHVPDSYKVVPSQNLNVNMQDSTYTIRSTGKCPTLWIVPKYKNYFMNSGDTSSGNDSALVWVSKDERKMSRCQLMVQRVTAFYEAEFNKLPDVSIIHYGAGKEIETQWLRENLAHNWPNHYHLDSSGIIFSQVLTNYYCQQFIQTLEPKARRKLENSEANIPYLNISKRLRSFDHNPNPDYFWLNENFTYYTQCCGKYVGSALFAQLETYLGPDSFRQGLHDYLLNHEFQEISFDGLLHFLSQREHKDLIEFLINHQSPEHLSDYQIENVTLDKDSIYLHMRNNGGSKPPFPIEVHTILEKKEYWFDGFSGNKSVSFPNKPKTGGKKEFTMDPKSLLRESSNEKQILTIDEDKNPLRWKLSDQKYFKNNVNVLPGLGYNFGDKFMAGLYLTRNYPDYFRGLFFKIMPLYSFSAKRIVGQGEVGYSWFPVEGPHKISASVFTKSYDKFYQKNLNYRERFIKVQPSFAIDFVNRKNHFSQGIELQPVFLWEEEGQFDSKGMFTGTSYQHSLIWRGYYWYEKTSPLGDFDAEIWFEQQRYQTPFSDKKADYGKVTFQMNKTFFLSSYYKLQTRVFASAFAWNSQKNSASFNPVFTRGSIALSHQSFNDYLYDEDYLVRENQNLGLGQQVSFYQGGGFKHATGSQFQVGMSNRYAAAINLVADFPHPKLDFLKVYLDTGVYGNTDNKASFLYSGGLAIYIKESLRIYYPLFMSKEFSATYSGKGFSFEKISFSFTLDEFFKS